VSYDVEGPEPVRKRSVGRPLRTAVVLVALLVVVVLAGRWGWNQLTRPFEDVAAAASPTPTASPGCTPAAAALPAPSTITVNVYNAGRVQGLARTASEQLAARGFVIGAVDNDPLDKNLEGVGEIRSSPAAQPQVQALLQYLPGATWVQDGRADATLDFAAGSGFTGVVDPPPPATPAPGCLTL
jgi:hypothetical protein